MMTPEKFRQQMLSLKEVSQGDPEAAHCEADKLMCQMLRDLGYGDGADVFEAEDFISWCA